MEKSRMQELERLVVSQKEQLTRYETRLKDVVQAYKGLLKEKEALESALSSSSKDTAKEPSATDEASKKEEEAANPSEVVSAEEKQQIATIMNSLATLSAEKSRMEMSFQMDKRQLRQELAAKDKTIKQLQDKLRDNSSHLDAEYKSKLIVERHAREKETSDQLLMIRDLQKLLSDERHLKESLEMQLNDLRMQIVATSNAKRNKDLGDEVDALRKQLHELEVRQGDKITDTKAIQRELDDQEELIAQLKVQHAAALRMEQRRALQAEQETKKLTLFHEERVSTLEARLSELSVTVGNYDRLRQHDQENIQKLKERLVESVQSIATPATTNHARTRSVDEIIEEIHNLKQLLMIENAKLTSPADISAIVAPKNDHSTCIDEQKRLRQELELTKSQLSSAVAECDVQRNHIRNLQDKIKVLNQNIEEQEMDLKSKTEQLAVALKAERDKWKQIVQSMEIDCRGKTAELEQHLQKQRDRSLKLLEEKEGEIKALKTSFELFVPIDGESATEATPKTLDSGEQSNDSNLNPLANQSATEQQFHILHYVHELARKDLEISALRKTKHSAETAMRQAIKDKIASQEELHDRISDLEEQVGRLTRCQSREGANLEYLKNVILSFLITKNLDSKRHMINAIAEVLKFSPNELKMVSNYFYNKK